MRKNFSGLAAVLQPNSARARQITAASHKATGSDASLQSSNPIAILQRILTESADIGEVVELSAEQMLEILTHVNTVHTPLQNLAKMQGLLQTVGILAKIESTRITASVNLSGLSSEIKRLAEEVQQHVDRIIEEASTLSEVLQNGVRELNRFAQQGRVQSADLIRNTQAVLGPMEERSEASRAAALNIDGQYTNFHRATDQVVMSLQAEDIARQRVEHVQEAIRRVAASLDAGESVESCAGVLALQRSQLASTRDLLADSIRTIHVGLLSLGPRIQALVGQTASLAERAGGDGQSLVTVIESGLETVSAVFEQCSSSASAALAIVDSVLPKVEKMTRGAYAIKEIGASIHLISLNAAIKTTQLGSKGVAMGVIASELRSITRNSEDDTRIVLDGLDDIDKALAKIAGEEADSENHC